jgi:hypothetical protein
MRMGSFIPLVLFPAHCAVSLSVSYSDATLLTFRRGALRSNCGVVFEGFSSHTSFWLSSVSSSQHKSQGPR